MKLERGLLVAGFLLVAALFTTPCLASTIRVDFEKQKGTPVTTSSVTVVKAESVGEGGDLRITGQLKRTHRLSMAGHLHAYLHSANNDLIADSQHRVLGLNSQRSGLMRVPFKFSIEDVSAEINRVYLEYHSPGHAEI
jgi:hypothetical protein